MPYHVTVNSFICQKVCVVSIIAFFMSLFSPSAIFSPLLAKLETTRTTDFELDVFRCCLQHERLKVRGSDIQQVCSVTQYRTGEGKKSFCYGKMGEVRD